MRILVLGVSGFIGSAVAARLCARGEEVIGVSRSRPPADPPVRRIALDDTTCHAADFDNPLCEGGRHT